jgi:hypothetical protein
VITVNSSVKGSNEPHKPKQTRGVQKHAGVLGWWGGGSGGRAGPTINLCAHDLWQLCNQRVTPGCWPSPVPVDDEIPRGAGQATEAAKDLQVRGPPGSGVSGSGCTDSERDERRPMGGGGGAGMGGGAGVGGGGVAQGCAWFYFEKKPTVCVSPFQ